MSKLTITLLFLSIFVLIVGCSNVFKIPSKAGAQPQDEDSTAMNEEKLTDQTNQIDTSSPDSTEKNKVLIYRDRFNPEKLDIKNGDKITWINKDDRIHKIACYENDKRFFLSDNLNVNDETSYTFKFLGTFLCVDAIFGLRQEITVQEPGFNQITGSVLVQEEGNLRNPIFAMILLILILGVLGYFYVVKKKKVKK